MPIGIHQVGPLQWGRINGRSEDGRQLAANAVEWLSTIRTDSGGISLAGIAAMPAPTMRSIWLLQRRPRREGDTIEAENCYQHAEHYFKDNARE